MGKKILATLLCFFLLSSPTMAATRATFINEIIEKPSLSITKTVMNGYESKIDDLIDQFQEEDPDSDYSWIEGEIQYRFEESLSSTLFSFTIEVDGKPYKNQAFQIITKDGIKSQGKTDTYGNFSLAGNETATFEYLGNNVSYKVTEEAADYFIQSPSTGTINGFMKQNAQSIRFTNTWLPPLKFFGLDESASKGSLEVHKHIAFPDGYAMPNNALFDFQITIDGDSLKSEKYDVYEENSGRLIGSQVTDRNGHFSLAGDQYAVFSDIPSNVDYRVEELLDTDGNWRTIGDAFVVGATSFPMTRVDFTNIEASFGVSKELSDGSMPDEIFTFYVSSEHGTWLADVSYYLYDNSGYRVDDVIYKTGPSGDFQLKAGQTAMFIGLEEGTVYSITEEAVEGYSFQTPASGMYAQNTVQDTVTIWPFVNRPDDLTGALAVAKQVRSLVSELPQSQETFTFRLEKRNTEGAYEVVPDAVYAVAVGDSTYTYKTDANGTFTLKANERALFSSLALDETYRVTEDTTVMPHYYRAETETKEGTLTIDGLSLLFTNLYEPNITLQLRKIDSVEKTPLAGVNFSLYYDENKTQVYREGITDQYGTLLFENLTEGTYYLAETDTVDGYWKMRKTIAVTFSYDDNGNLVAAADHDMDIQIDQGTGNAVMEIENTPLRIMPNSGGTGTILFIGSGIALLLAAAFLLLKKKP